MSERTRIKRPKGQDSDVPVPGGAPAIFPLATEEGRGTKRFKTPVPIVAFRGTEKTSTTSPPVSMTLPTAKTPVPIVAFRGTEKTSATSPPVSITLPTVINEPAGSPNQLSSIVFRLNQRQAEESQVFTAFASAIESQAARFAKSESGTQREAAQRLADALAVVFQSAINPEEREQAPSPSSSATPPPIAHPSLDNPLLQRCRPEIICSHCCRESSFRTRAEHRHLGLQAEPQAKLAKGPPGLFANAPP